MPQLETTSPTRVASVWILLAICAAPGFCGDAVPGQWRAAELVLDIFGSDGGVYANKPVVLNGVSLGNLPETRSDGWATKHRMQLGPAALHSLGIVNALYVHNAPGDCMKLRNIQVTAIDRDGKRVETNRDENAYSTPGRWTYAEGVSFPLKTPLGPIVLSFDPAIPRHIRLEQDWFCATTRARGGHRFGVYRPVRGSEPEIELALPIVAEREAKLGPVASADGRMLLRIEVEAERDAGREGNLLVKLRNPLKTAPGVLFVGRAPQQAERVACAVREGFIVAAAPAGRVAQGAFIAIPTRADTAPPRITLVASGSRALKHTLLTVRAHVEEDVGLRVVRAVGVGFASPAPLVWRPRAGCYVGSLALGSAERARFAVEAVDLFGNVARSDERTVATFLPHRLRGVQYGPRDETLTQDVEHLASLGANVIAVRAHSGPALRRLIAEAHARGMLVFWNMHPNWARCFQPWLRSHPDSIIRASDGRVAVIDADHDGTKDKAYGCFSSMPFREHVARYVAEVFTDYDFDGLQIEEPYYFFNDLCYCKHCRDGFAAYLSMKYPGASLTEAFGAAGAQGVHVPSEKERTEYRREWFEWTECHVCAEMGWLESTLGAARDATARTWRKELKYTGYCQGTDRWYMWPGLFSRRLSERSVTLINSGAWYRKAEARVDEPRLCLLNAELAGGAARRHGKASMLWVQAWPCDYGLPFGPRDLVVDTMEVFAHGAGMIALGNLTRTGDAKLADAARQTYSLIQAAEGPLTGAEKIATTAIFYSYNTLKYDWLKTQAEYTHHVRYLAFLLARGHVPFDIVDELSQSGLAAYKMLILDSVAILTPHQIRSIAAWVRAGGALVLVGPCGVQDQYGRPLVSAPWRELTGSAVWSEASKHDALLAHSTPAVPGLPERVTYGRTLLEIPQPRHPLKNPRRTRLADVGHSVRADGSPLMRWESGGEAIVVRAHGRGHVMVCGAFPEYAVPAHGQALVKAICAWAKARGDEPVPADADIEVVAYAGGKDHWVMLMNHGREPKRNVRVTLAAARALPGPVEVLEIRGSQDAPCGYAFVKTNAVRVHADGHSFTLPQLGLFAAVRLQCAP